MADSGDLERVGDAHLVQLDRDHPGFRDPVYRGRRDAISRIALAYRSGDPIPDAPYTEEEHQVWREVWRALAPVHQERVCRELLALQRTLDLPRDHIPQLRELNPRLTALSGFRMEPVGGLVSARTFMRYLGRRVFLSTQYIRHHSHPLYTPEPDVVHELVGHAATLAHPDMAALNLALGDAADVASDAEMLRIENVYWYVVEFGVLEEDGVLKAFGAGLLSSPGELRDFAGHAELRPWDLESMATTPFDATDYQPWVYVAPSFERMVADTTAWVRDGGWRL